MRHRLSRLADRDIDRLYRESIGRYGPRHADRYLTELHDAIRTLAELPESARERPELPGAVRIRRHEAHHIIYRVEADEVVIVRVLHGRQDITRHLKP